MNLLDLVNMVREECAASGANNLPLGGLDGVSGSVTRFKNWVIRSWNEIQQLHDDWKWMRAAYSFTTTEDKGSYTPVQAGIATRFNFWDRTYCTVLVTDRGISDQTELIWMEYEAFRSVYLTGNQTSGRPRHFSIGLENELLVGPEPDAVSYTISGQYAKSEQVLSVYDDVPEMPELHETIAYLAMLKYARFESAIEIIQDASRHYSQNIRKLENKYLPTITLPEPML